MTLDPARDGRWSLERLRAASDAEVVNLALELHARDNLAAVHRRDSREGFDAAKDARDEVLRRLAAARAAVPGEAGTTWVTQADADAAFHAHLDECQRCREEPMRLCLEGARRLRSTAIAEPIPAPAPVEPDWDGLARALREMVLTGEKHGPALLGVLSRMRFALKQAFRAASASGAGAPRR